jgi:hypothetical protein
LDVTVFATIGPASERFWTRIEPDEPGRQIVEVHQVVRDLEGQVLLDRTFRHVYR